MQRGITQGYLPQDGLTLSGRTIFAECMGVFADLHEMERELETLHHSLGELDPASLEYSAAADRLHHIDTEFRNRDGYAIEAQVGTVLDGLGFRKEDWTRRTEEFSGGWQMRIALAKLLLEKPNMLLLDEPTNHLDLEARNWLEPYLTNYPFAYVLISHDRYFLDVTVNKTVEIWNKQVYFYSGNYDKYLRQKDERRTQLEAAYRNQRERIEQLEAFINRFRYQATKAKQVQSRIKELEKIERIEIPPEEQDHSFFLPAAQAERAHRRGIQRRFEKLRAKHVFSGANFIIERGDRIALVGINGAGKSTMIKLLAGAEPLSSGSYTLGHNVMPDYFAQDQYKELDVNARLIDDLSGAAKNSTQTELRTLLGCFLFSDDDVFKQIGVLSGGERNRYALARMLLAPSNFLLLDEPTNHLDMRAKGRAARSPEQVFRNGGVRFARPLFHRQPGHADFRNRRRPRTRVSGQLRGLFVAQAGRAGNARGPDRAGARRACGGRSRRFEETRESDQAEEASGPVEASGAAGRFARIRDRAARGRARGFQERGRDHAAERSHLHPPHGARNARGGVGRTLG